MRKYTTRLRTREEMLRRLESEYVFEQVDRIRLKQYLRKLVEKDQSLAINVYYFNLFFGLGVEEPMALIKIYRLHDVTRGQVWSRIMVITRHLRLSHTLEQIVPPCTLPLNTRK
jgi:uncharacterized membrane protein YhaH (DUF805 family)